MDVCKTLFSVVLNMSLTGGIVIVLVMLVRLFLRRMPRKFSYLLWGVVLLRLLCPISFSSVLSVFQMFHAPVTQQGRIEYVPQGSVRMEMQDGVLPVVVPNYVVGTMYETVEPPVSAETEIPASSLSWGLGEICGMVWLLGTVILWLYSLIGMIRLRRQLVGAVPKEKNIYLCDYIGTAFVLGVFRPRIYLPTRLAGTEREYILLHEQTHIRRGDQFFRLLAFLALSLHWFNPLVWCAFRLSERDMEMSCDEAVMEKMGLDLRVAYSTSLMNVAGGRLVFAGAPLGFGEGNVKCRVRNIMKYRKTAAWIACPALIVIAIVFIALGSNPTRSNAAGQPAGQDGDGLSGAQQAEGGSPGTPQTDHNAPDVRGDAPQTSGDVVQIAVTTPVITEKTPCGADVPQLDYADKNILIFHDYFGLFVYDMMAGTESPAFLGAVALEPIGCHYTQGASYCDVRASKDGRMVYLHPLDIKDMYVYDVQNRTLIRTKYDLGGVELFDGLIPTEECVEAYDGGYSDFSVFLGDRYLTLEYRGSMAMDLYAVILENGQEMGCSKLFPNYGRQEIFDILNELKYQPYTCDGLPEYRLTAADGTVYALNFSEKWVWRGNSEQAELSDELIAQLKEDSRLVIDALTDLTEDDTRDNAVRGSEIDPDNPPVNWGTPDGPEIAAKNYYAGTVFELVSLEVMEASKEHVIFTVVSKKGGVLVEPNRTIELQYKDGAWNVINEGY